ncbi:MAG: protein translocase subunit SecDF [Saprospiraceae bacterium]|nr:protein translocase subunit SecDF [Saprospiraceae bacterium]
MQGKGVVRFFLVVMLVVTLIQYLTVIPTNRVERDADAFAKSASDQVQEELRDSVLKSKRTEFLDSMSTEEVFRIPMLKSYTYQELKAQQLALGLDLKGGMSVVLQVDLREFLRSLANDSKDPTFVEALEKASQAQKTAQSDFITLFADEWKKIRADKRLAPIFQRNEALRDEINYETSDGDVVGILRSKSNETVDLTFKLLKERIDKLGVTQPNVSLDSERDLILVELPGIDNPERARNYLQATAKLEFWKVYRMNDPGLFQAFASANNVLANTENVNLEPQILRIDTFPEKDTAGVDIPGTIARIDTTYDTNSNAGPLFSILSLNPGNAQTAILGYASRNKVKQVNEYLSREEVQSLFPADISFHWSKDPVSLDGDDKNADQYQLYGIKTERQEAPLSGDHVTDAAPQPDPNTNEIGVSVKMDGTGAKTWARLTTEAAQDNRREIAILLDDEVVSAPSVNEPITGGSSSITGRYSVQEATDFANILQVGKLPAETKIIQENLVGPSLGQDNIDRSLRALVIGFAILLAFMIVYYGGGGIISIIALLLNMIFIFGALASLGTVLTLPGIAGIILTIGMAVDANVIIYERIREEVRAGKSMLIAIADGFKNSYSAIIDANVTTILTAFVLAYFGLGPIKGFAVVLIIGVISSLFTAVLVGRLMIDWWTSKGRGIQFDTNFSRNAFASLNIDWLGKRKIAYAISLAIIVLGFGSMFMRGFELGVDFKGGYSYNITMEQETSADQLREALTTAFEGSAPVVKVVDNANTFNVTTDYLIDAEEVPNQPKPVDLVMDKLFAGVNSVAGGSLEKNNFKNPDGKGTHVTSSSRVGPTIADDIQDSAFQAAIFALLLIFGYIFVRFSKWQYSMGAVAALFHDTLIVLAIFSLGHGVFPWTMEIDQAFIAAILTVIGYSINDTVVVFDRIREYLNIYTKNTKEEVINMAVNSTISRTIITSVTTFFMVAVLFIFGGASIKGFAFALLVGILVGTYSSVFIATPIMSDLSGDLKPKEVDKKKSFSRAAAKAK